MLARLAAFVHDHRRRVLIAAVIAFAFAGALGGGVAKRLDPYGAQDPATDSYHADKLIERSGVQGAPGLIALVRGSEPVDSAGTRAKVAAVVRVLRADPAVGSVTTFYGSHDRAMVSSDGRSTYVATRFKPLADKSLEHAAKRLAARLGHEPGVTLGGYGIAFVQVNKQVESDLIRAELFAFPLLLLLSLLFFRSLIAAALPLLVGGLAIVGTFVALRLYSEVTSVSVFALNLTTGLGLGLAIDYSLFIVSRYREELARGLEPRAALVRTLETAGRTVLFSSLTVAAALASLLVFPQRFLYSMGLGGATVALIAATVALVVLPAVLAALGPRVNALAPARLQRAAARDAQPDEAGGWYRLSRFVMRRAAPVAVASAALLIALGIPFLSARFTSVDASVLPTSATARQVDDALRADFPPHRDSPITVAVDTTGAASPAETRGALASLRSAVSRLPGVMSVGPVQPLGPHASLLTVVSAAGPYTQRSENLVGSLRGLDHPGADVSVGGQTAQFTDLKSSLTSHLPLAILIVAAGTLVILFLMTGSVVLPLKALVMNLLTLSAAFGVLVLVFQDGRFEGLLGYSGQGALEATMPVLLFAVTLGLSTDYGVFLLSRIKEARDNGASDSEAVAIGLERTGRIVTAAALLFCVAFGSFVTSQIIFIKESGLGTAAAVLIDATIVRALLVPSLMALLGSRNWWAPRPLRRLHARIGLGEGSGRPGSGSAQAAGA